MRDDTDTVTQEIPGIEPAPAQAPALTIKQRRERCGYKGPREGPQCRSCHYVGVASIERGDVCCELHGFEVQLGGICADWEPLS